MLIASSSARAVGFPGSVSMPECLHTAKHIASANVCTQHDALPGQCCQNAEMNFIRYWRSERGMTLQALGDELEPNASAGTVQSYESGSRDPSLSRLIDMARALGVSPGKLLDGPPPIPTEAQLAAMLATAQNELMVGVSLGDYPTAVASSLRDQLLQFLGVPANAGAASAAPKKPRAANAQLRAPTKRSAAG